MTIEEYLTGVKRVYYQLSIIVEGKQLLADGNSLLLEGSVSRLTDIRDDMGRLISVRFPTLRLPPTTMVDKEGVDHAVINYGNVRLVIWPIKEIKNVEGSAQLKEVSRFDLACQAGLGRGDQSI